MDTSNLQVISKNDVSIDTTTKETIKSDEAEERGLSNRMEHLKKWLTRHPYSLEKLMAVVTAIF
ncbi:hypothetical protein GN958_ATG00146 [Phytophthora infestans]|nr:hypothetical protein GN958_ATG00146 [Phytophthora infestans]